MRSRWKKAGAIALAAAVLVTVGTALFFNGYGPLAWADRRVRTDPGEAKGWIDNALHTTMDAVSPPLAYVGADFEVEREKDRWDGEPSMVSDVTEIVTVRTVVSKAKLPVLMDQVTKAWMVLGSRVIDHSDPSLDSRSLRGVGDAGGQVFLTFYADPAQGPSSYTVMFRAEAGGVLYQPAHEYQPLSPLPRTPRDAKGYVVNNPVDDPYWSH
ncbi:hypothetical protein [Kitasatospora aureofaciens]|uniref:hypothetical protein n=1 Tax=Kitasatospora aureofaciens TaxID=1894 RepID=UPI0005242F34|nr:hypothetical protein [Kitasatospora aureofaciens]HJD85213.1 hypothetical protein [Kitasatospora aureofaciens]